MAKQLGRALLLKIGDGDDPEVFTTIASLNTKTFTINNNPIDATTPDALNPEGVLWDESLSGMKSLAVSGDGIFTEADVEKSLHTAAFSLDSTANFEIVAPGLGTYTGNFRIASYEGGGESEGTETFSVSLQSNGAVTFTPAA